MGIAGTQLGATIGHQVGVNTDWNQPNAGGGGGSSYTPWDLTTLTSASSSNKDVTGVQNTLSGVWWKPDGTKVFFIGTAVDQIYSYVVPTPWDLSSIVAAAVGSGLVLGDTLPKGLWIAADGVKTVWCGDQGNDVNQADMGTPWDISTLGSVTTLSMGADGVLAPLEVRFNSDGTKMYIQELPADYKISQYDLGTAYDVTTGVYVDEYDYSSDTSSDYSNGFWINGNEIYINGQGSKVFKFTWDGGDITSMTYDSEQAYTNSDSGEGGLWMDDEYVSYFTTVGDNLWLHTWGPHE
tara:strand:- start:1388 stop:2272 length:885 start_codon:yes stop_codon:yes gene_type:complete